MDTDFQPEHVFCERRVARYAECGGLEFQAFTADLLNLTFILFAVNAKFVRVALKSVSSLNIKARITTPVVLQLFNLFSSRNGRSHNVILTLMLMLMCT